jgi:acyl phosphate:glycerol-3-phosphate acyltransferase
MISAFALLLAYLIASVSLSVLYSRSKSADVRAVDFAGASGMGRRYGWRVGVAIAIADILKGALAAGVVLILEPNAIWFAPAVVALGHCYPVWHGFNGGQGLSPATGALWVADPLTGLVTMLSGLGVMALHRLFKLERIVKLAAQPTGGIVGLLIVYITARARAGEIAGWGVALLGAVLLIRGLQVLLSPKPGSS